MSFHPAQEENKNETAITGTDGWTLLTFISIWPREMEWGEECVCVCLSVCVSVCAV